MIRRTIVAKIKVAGFFTAVVTMPGQNYLLLAALTGEAAESVLRDVPACTFALLHEALSKMMNCVSLATGHLRRLVAACLIAI